MASPCVARADKRAEPTASPCGGVCDDVTKNTLQRIAIGVATMGLMASRTTAAQAQESAPPITLAVEVPPECPSDLAAQILSRTPRTRLARQGEPARRVDARIVKVDDRYRGAVALDGQGGEPVVRQVEAPSCNEVTAALALIAALAIDPEASLAPQAPPPPPPPPSIAPAPTPTIPQEPGSSEPSNRFLEVQPAVEAGFGVISGVAPRVIAGGILMLELGIPREDPLVLVRAGASYWTNGQIAILRADGTANAAAAYSAVLARIETCVALRVERFWAAPCATFDVGSLTVEGSENGGTITAAYQESQLWAAPGPAARVGWDAVGPLTIAVDGALTFPLKRDTYVVEEPRQIAHDVPIVAARAGIYATLRFR